MFTKEKLEEREKIDKAGSQREGSSRGSRQTCINSRPIVYLNRENISY